MLDVTCPGCRRSLKVKEGLAGRKGKCPHCGYALAVPATAAASSSAHHAAAPEAATAAPDAAAVEERGETHTDVAPTGGAAPPSPLTEFLSPPQGPDEIGRLGPYRVLKVLGAGGMGVVYRAEDPHLQRLVALKVMLPALAASASAKQRFLREARTAAALEHDNVVAIYQVGEDRGIPYLAMPLLRGESLDDRIKRNRKGEVLLPLPLAEALRIARETATGLEAARRRGLIHRDIKPANLWLEEETGRVKILDFGLARAAAGDAQLTQEGAILGTPAYMAPEQAGGTADHRADLFSLGCVLYRMTTGETPFKGTDTISTLMAVATEAPRRPSEINPALPAAVSDLILRLLAKKPEERPASAQAVVEAIRTIETDPTQTLPARKAPPPIPARKSPPAKPLPKPAGATPATGKAPAPPKTQQGSARLWMGLGAAGLLAAGALAVGAYLLMPPSLSPRDHSAPPATGPDHADGDPLPAAKGGGRAQPLFNGQNLNGWTVLRGNKSENWGAEDGVLYTTGAKRNWLLTDQEYGDFEVHLEYKLADRAKTAVGLRAAADRGVSLDGLEVELIDEAGYANDKPPLRPNELNGALLGLAPPAGTAAKPAGEWNRVQITAQGRNITEKINDAVVLQADLDRFKDQAAKFPAVLRTKGRIGLQSVTGRVEFRDVSVRPLPPDDLPGVQGGGVGP